MDQRHAYGITRKECKRSPLAISVLERGGWPPKSYGHFNPEKGPVPIVQEARWDQGLSKWVKKSLPR
jgi:hypothetical protein